MKLSIIITAYNIVKLGKEPIEKMKEFISDSKDVEVIYVNDGSTDGTEEFIKKNFKDSRVQVLNQENTGVAEARVNGVKAISPKSTHVIFVDADDNLEGNIEEILSEKELKNTIFACDLIHNNNGKTTEYTDIKKRTTSLFERFIFRNAIYGYFFPVRMLNKGLTTERITFEDVFYILWAKSVEERFKNLKIKNIKIKSIVNVQEESLSKVTDLESKGFIRRSEDLKNVWTRTWRKLCKENVATKQIRYLFIIKYLSEYFHIIKHIQVKDIKESFEVMKNKALKDSTPTRKPKIKINLKYKALILLLKLRQYHIINLIIKKFMD